MSSELIQLRDQVGVLRRRWRLVVAVVLLAVAVGLGLSLLASPTYVSSTDVLLTPTTTTSTTSPGEVTTEQIATEAQSVTSYPVAQDVIDELKLDESPADLLDTVTVTPDPDGAAVLTIGATRGDADEAAAIANGIADNYLRADQQRRTDQLTQLDTQIQTLNGQVADVNARLSTAVAPDKGALLAQHRALIAQRDVLFDARAQLELTQLPSAGEVVRPAVAASSPASPKPVRDAVLAGVIGLLLGVAAAYLREYFDDKVRDESALRETLGDRPVLGRIPHLRDTASGRLTMLMEPHSPSGEAYRALGVNVRFLVAATAGPQHASTRVSTDRASVALIASANQGEGKTSTAANLAVVSATAGLRVILIDADLRRPRISGLFGLGSVAGLADYLAGGPSLDDVLLDVGVDDLQVLPAGTLPPNPAELLASTGMRTAVDVLASKADLVIVDTPAMLAVSDALELVPLADLTVVVARAKLSRRRVLASVVQRIEQVGGVVPGGVLNDVDAKAQEYTQGYSG